jgi:hypothetical protein
MYRCMPVGYSRGTRCRSPFEDPLDPAKVDELRFVAKKDFQLVLANPDILAAIDRHYGDESSEDVDKILAELGGDEKITEEAKVAAETSDEDLRGRRTKRPSCAS